VRATAPGAPVARVTFQLKNWRTDPKLGQPKLAPAAESLVERGLMRLDATLRPPRLSFTEPGLVALRAMMADRRLANPAQSTHVRQELGIDPAQQDEVAAN
jgi:2-hydroxychromene-2-carboxylate isomerase